MASIALAGLQNFDRPGDGARAAGVAPAPDSDVRAQRGTQEPTTASPRGSDRVSLSAQAIEQSRADAANEEGATNDEGVTSDEDAVENLGAPRGQDGEPLSEEEQQQVDDLEARDREVRTHEQAHLAAAGPYATSGATYTFEQGPDGRRYAVGGEVQIDTSTEATPEENITKFQVVRRAALAPVEPSPQDRRVAALASQRIAEARTELAAQRQEEQSGESDTADAAGDSFDGFGGPNASAQSLGQTQQILGQLVDALA